MAIILPSMPAPREAEPFFIDAGGWQKPITIGDATRIDLLGDKFGLNVTMPPMDEETGLKWISRLNNGRSHEVIMEYPQYRLPPISKFAARPNGAHVAQTTILTITNMLNATIQEGRFFSVFAHGRYWLHQSASETITVDGNSIALPIIPRTRKIYPNNANVDFDTPKIQGILEGNVNSWTISNAMHIGLQFEIMEAR